MKILQLRFCMILQMKYEDDREDENDLDQNNLLKQIPQHNINPDANTETCKQKNSRIPMT